MCFIRHILLPHIPRDGGDVSMFNSVFVLMCVWERDYSLSLWSNFVSLPGRFSPNFELSATKKDKKKMKEKEWKWNKYNSSIDLMSSTQWSTKDWQKNKKFLYFFFVLFFIRIKLLFNYLWSRFFYSKHKIARITYKIIRFSINQEKRWQKSERKPQKY